MSLRPCNECSREVSTGAKACPHCGKMNPTGMGVGAKVFIGFTVLVVFAGLMLGGGSSTSHTVQPPAAPEVDPEVARLERERPRADSLLTVLSRPAIRAAPDSVLEFLARTANPQTDSAKFRIAVAEATKRADRRRLNERIEAVLGMTRSASTIEGGRCTKASKAKVERLIAKYPGWDNDMLSTVACGWIKQGMTKEQVIASWGRPDDINRTVGSWGVHEQWIYNDYGPYVYLEDGIVTSWQT